ncbi:hypothetical protein [Flavobacterium sp. XS2P39]|uniref:hypothetical protein n=1 Tax=Flavobacterium sp. XS2P39 TaxID=3401725 RepID=UPI003AAECDF7
MDILVQVHTSGTIDEEEYDSFIKEVIDQISSLINTLDSLAVYENIKQKKDGNYYRKLKRQDIIECSNSENYLINVSLFFKP